MEAEFEWQGDFALLEKWMLGNVAGSHVPTDSLTRTVGRDDQGSCWDGISWLEICLHSFASYFRERTCLLKLDTTSLLPSPNMSSISGQPLRHKSSATTYTNLCLSCQSPLVQSSLNDKRLRMLLPSALNLYSHLYSPPSITHSVTSHVHSCNKKKGDGSIRVNNER